jgi:hypothetical protein
VHARRRPGRNHGGLQHCGVVLRREQHLCVNAVVYRYHLVEIKQTVHHMDRCGSTPETSQAA